jgi:aryl-alcohol dehydrogenase-like predicted oxidoreductase
MDHLISSGRALYWGTSEWSAVQLLEAHDYARQQGLHAPALEQPEYNLLRRYKVEHMFRPLIETKGLGLVTWSPLSSGVLSGKYLGDGALAGRASGEEFYWLRDRIADPAVRDKLFRVKAIADGAGLSMARLAICWCLGNPDVTSVILGATSKAQLADNLAALAEAEALTPSIMAELDKAVGLECI